MAQDPLSWLQDWYLSRCDGDWEHDWGIEIGTLDNPGWSMTIDLVNTPLAAAGFDKVFVTRSTRDWVSCEVVQAKFKAYCGPQNLLEVIERFRAWSEANTSDG